MILQSRQRRRMIYRLLNLVFAAFLLALVPCAAPAAEPVRPKWADSKLKVSSGMLLWLDAATLNAAREASGLAKLTSDDSLESWPDGSGHGWNFSQADKAARPTYRDEDGLHAVRF